MLPTDGTKTTHGVGFRVHSLHVWWLRSEGTKKNVLTEADLLAGLVQRIDFATAAVPRGAHRLHGTKIIPATEVQGEMIIGF